MKNHRMNRPLLCVAIAFVLGEAFECQRIHPLIGLLSILVITGIIAKYTDDIRKRRGIIRWIFISSLFFVMGYFNLSEKESQIFVPNDQESVMLQGDIYKLEEKNKGAYLYIENVAIDELQHSRKILAYVPDEVEEDASECFFKGDRIAVSGKLSAFAQASNPGAFDEALYYRSLNLDGKMYVDTVSCLYQGPLWKRWIGALRNDLVSIYKACLPKDYGVVSAMVLGEKSALDPEIKKYYQRCGIAHILAISGLHVAMIGMALYQILRKTGIRIGISAVCAFCFIWLYGFFTDFGISTKRAVCMFILGILAKVLGRTYDLLTAAAISLMILLIEMPMLIYNSGVWFSFFAVAGIELIMPALAMLINSKKVSQIAGASLSVTLMTLPLSAWFSFEIPVYSVFLNLIVVPLMSSVVFLVVLGALAGSLHLLSGRFLMGMVHYILVFYTWLCQMNLKLPGAVAVVGRPPLWAVFLYYGSLAVFIYIGRKGIQKAWIALIAIMFIFVRPPKTGLLVSALDVGQGDGNIITYHGCTYMIDGGSTSQKNVASYQIVPYLKYQGIAAVDYVFLSHGDEDHIGGVKEMIESQDLLGIEIGHLVITDITHEAAGGIEEIAESATGYSFPSGHTTNAMSCYGGTAMWQRKHKAVVIPLIIAAMLTGFARNWLCAHTPQDVCVALILTTLFLFAAAKGMAWIEAHPDKETTVLVAGLLLVAVLLLYIQLKPYPVNYLEDGSLLVDPYQMKTDCYKAYGAMSGILIAWYAERKWVKFDVEGSKLVRLIRFVVGAGICLGIKSLGLDPIKSVLGTHWGMFVFYMIQIVFIIALYPAIFTSVEKRLKK